MGFPLLVVDSFSWVEFWCSLPAGFPLGGGILAEGIPLPAVIPGVIVELVVKNGDLKGVYNEGLTNNFFDLSLGGDLIL